MKACNACHVHVQTASSFCPLCGTELLPGEAPKINPPPNMYPDLSKAKARYDLVTRILLFISIFGCAISVLINLLVMPRFLWSLIVVASVVYCWLAIPPMVRRGVNFASQIVVTVLLTSTLAIALDFIIGYRGWSVTYVLPALLSAGIAATAIMALFNRTNWAQFVLYQVLVGVFGFLPLVFYMVGLAQNMVMVLVTAGLALASLLITLIFGDRTIKSEFKRRFHF